VIPAFWSTLAGLDQRYTATVTEPGLTIPILEEIEEAVEKSRKSDLGGIVGRTIG
jgi:hypothetical protein